MPDLLPILIAVGMLAVLGVLFTGVFSMVKGGEFNRRYGNRLMRWRVLLQLGVVILLLLVFLFGRGG